jgi:hypothetical protein
MVRRCVKAARGNAGGMNVGALLDMTPSSAIPEKLVNIRPL